MTSKGIPYWARFAALLATGLVLAFVENWMLWGFFVSRPSLEGELAHGDRLVGVSMLRFDPQPLPVPPPDRMTEAVNAAAVCRPDSNECLEGRLVLGVERLFGSVDGKTDVALPVLRAAWTELVAKGWLPRVRDPAYKATGVPVAGLAIHFRRPDEHEYFLLGYRTSAIANDLYAYSEALFRISGTEVALIKQVRFYLDIAGIEGLEWPILWPVNFFALLLFSDFIPVGHLRKWMSKALHWRMPDRAGANKKA